jgi:hypothetical protein
MKKLVKNLMFSCSVVLSLPFVLMFAFYITSFLSFYTSSTNTNACTQYYVGVNKGTIWDRGEWHHYVDFEVDNSAPSMHWEVADAPLPSSLWWDYSMPSSVKRVAYRWPSNWSDPFPASDWKICVENS